MTRSQPAFPSMRGQQEHKEWTGIVQEGKRESGHQWAWWGWRRKQGSQHAGHRGSRGSRWWGELKLCAKGLGKTVRVFQGSDIWFVFLKDRSPFLEIPDISEIQNKYTSQEVLLRCLISRIYYKIHIPITIEISETISMCKTQYSYTPDKLPIPEFPAFFLWPLYCMLL